MYRYIGNKTRLAAWLVEHISSLVKPGAIIADPMCGTASVSDALRRANYRVIASDIMTFSAQHARVRLLLDRPPQFNGIGLTYEQILLRLNSLRGRKGFFYREYSPDGAPQSGTPPRLYLTAANAARLDAISDQIARWYSEGRTDELENSLLRHDLVLAVNRVANIAGTYGHHRSTWSGSAHTELRLTPSTFTSEYRTDHVVLQGPAETIVPTLAADLCYIDPPYMKRQYAANYHLIETVARGDQPDAIGVSGLRPWRDQYSVFCTRTKIQDAFTNMILSSECSLFVISYSADGLLSEEELHGLFAPLGHLKVMKRPLPRFRSNASPLGSHVDEFLLTLRKRTKRRRLQDLHAAAST